MLIYRTVIFKPLLHRFQQTYFVFIQVWHAVFIFLNNQDISDLQFWDNSIET